MNFIQEIQRIRVTLNTPGHVFLLDLGVVMAIASWVDVPRTQVSRMAIPRPLRCQNVIEIEHSVTRDKLF